MGRRNHSVKIAVATLALTALILSGCQPQQRQTADQTAGGGSEGTAEAVAADKVIATANGGPITLERVRLYQYMRLYNPGLDIPEVPVAPSALTEHTTGVLAVAERIAAYEAAAAAMQKDAPTTQTQPYKQVIERGTPELIKKYLVFKHVDDKLDPISTEQAAKFYEEHKQEFRLPFMFRMRHLILMTYEPYTVTAGDLAPEGGLSPLESIAERVSGGKDNAALIRADLPGRPLRREEGKAFKPLIEGEKLLVPMNDEKNEAVHQRLLGILAELKGDKKFEDLARQYSEAQLGGEVSEWMPTGTLDPHQILPEIEAAAKATKIGEVSQPFKTRHGWQAIQIVEKQEEGFQQFRDVRSSIVQRMQEKQRKRLTDEMYTGLMSQPGIKIHYELLATSSTSKIDPNALVAQIDTGATTPTVVRWGQFEQKWQRTHPTKPEGIREALQGEGEFVQKAIDMWTQAQLGRADSELNRLLAAYRQCAMGVIWISNQAAHKAHQQVTEAEILKYYEDHKQETSGPELVKIMFMERRLGGEEQKLTGIPRKDALERKVRYVKEDLASCKTAADFRVNATSNRVLIEGPNPLAGESKEIPVDSVPSPIREKIEGLAAGKWTEPFLLNDFSAVSVLVEERTPAGIRPLEKVREPITAMLTRMRYSDSVKQLEQDYVKKSGFQSQL